MRRPWPIRCSQQGGAGCGRLPQPPARRGDQPRRPAPRQAGRPGRTQAAEATRDRVDHAGQLLATAGDNPERLRGEAAFAHLCGTAPVPASSGKTTAIGCTAVVTATPTGRCTWRSWSACAGARAPAPMPSGAPRMGPPSRRSCAVSSATSSARLTTPWSPTSRPSTPLDDLHEHPGISGGSGMPLVVEVGRGYHARVLLPLPPKGNY